MTDEAEVTMLLYADLTPDEERKLKSIDGQVSNTLIDHGINRRPIWKSHLGAEARSIRLCLFGDSEPQILFELPEDKVAELSASDIISYLHSSLE